MQKKQKSYYYTTTYFNVDYLEKYVKLHILKVKKLC